MREKFLRQRLLRLQAKKNRLAERAKVSTDVNEVRALTEQLDDINADIDEVNEELRSIEADRAAEQSEQRSADPVTAETAIPENAVRVGAETARSVVGSFAVGETRDGENILESMEYREAFRQLWTRGTPINADLMGRVRAYVATLPEEQRAGTPINTSNTAAVIPLTIMREVINKIRTPFGNIYDAVRKTSVPGAVEYPIGEFQADFHWVTEGTVSPEQDIGSVSTVRFGYFEAELRIAQTFLSALLSIDAFEAEISSVIARAYRKFADNAIVNADGKGKITGLAAGTTKTITMTGAQMGDWRQWDKRFFAELVPGYEDGKFIFARSTVIKYLKTMADANNRPLFYEATGLTVGDGDRVNDRGFFYGREILMTVPEIVKDFDTASSNDVIGFYFQPENYIINENFGFTVDRYYNYERRKWITVATVVIDGKPLNNTGFIKILKG